MASTMCSSSCCCFGWKNYSFKHCSNQNRRIQQSMFIETCTDDGRDKLPSGLFKRRSVVVQTGFGLVPLISSFTGLGIPSNALAVVKQGPLAGRVPGLSEPDEQGYNCFSPHFTFYFFLKILCIGCT